MAGKKDIVEQALKLVMGGSNEPAKKAMRLYHGTKSPKPFSRLDPSKSEFGVHFGTPEQANTFATPYSGGDVEPGSRVIPMDVSLSNPVRLQDYGRWDADVVYSQLADKGVLPLDLKLLDKYSNDPYSPEYYKEIQDMLRSSGHDGIVYLNRREGINMNDVDAFIEETGDDLGVPDEEFKAAIPEASDSYIVWDEDKMKSPFGEGPGAGFNAGGRTGYAGKGRVVGSVVGDAVDAAMRLIAGAEPQKTVKAYKLFKQEGGKLYPLFVGANEEVPMNQWVKATAGPQAASGKVKSKIGELAYRPGWHAGDLPIATHIGAKSHGDPSLPPDTRPSNQVWGEVEMANDVDWQKVANERARMTKKGTPDPKTAHITDQVPYGGYYRYKTNPNMTGEWMIGGDMRVNRVLTDDEVKAINEAAGVADLPRREGYGPGGVIDDIVKMAGKIVSGADEPAKTGIRAYHGTPHDFDKFDMSKIGTGEGAQAYGHGLYFADNEGVARSYRDALAKADGSRVRPDDVATAKYKAEWDSKVSRMRELAPNYLPEPNVQQEYYRLQDNLDVLHQKMVADTIERNPHLTKGSMYEVNINADPNQFLDWDKPLSEQPETVRRLAGWTPGAEAEYRKASTSDTDALLAALEGESQYVPAKMPQPPGAILPFSATGDELHQKLFHQARRELEGKGASGAYSARVAEKLREAGIPGIKYLDAGSRSAGEGSRNYVVFDDKLISIIRKYGIAGASAMLGYNLMEQLDPKQALAASMADQDYQSSRPQRSMGGNNSISGALNVARGLHGVR